MRKFYLKMYLLLSALLLIPAMLFAQSGSISGKVLDEYKNPLPGATVTVLGTTHGAAADVNGAFTLKGLTPGKQTLVVKFIGYATQQQVVTVGAGATTVIFNLKADAKGLAEVVVIGYGTQKSTDVTGSIATVSAKDFNQGPVATPEQLIQGKVAGVAITSNSGAPGAGSTIRIRGGASVNGSSDPLIVIDGVPLSNDGIAGAANPLDLINPNDIESFSVLKDASSAAIYGNRASNGVILITTKKGQAGKPVINFTSQNSIGSLPKEYSVLSADQFRAFVNTYDTTSAKKYKSLLGNASTDWQKQIYQTSFSSDNNLSLSGTKGKLPYRISVGYTDQNGILKTTWMQRTSASLNLNPSLLKDHLKINLSVKGAQVNQRFANEGGAVGSAISFNPTLPVTSGNSNYGGYTELLDASTVSGLKALATRNPVGLLMENDNESTVYRAIASLGVDYKFHFLPDLHANVNVSYDGSRGMGSDFIPGYAASNIDSYKDPNTGTYYSGNMSNYKQTSGNTLFEGYFSYSKDINAIKTHVDAIAGYSFQDFSRTNYNYVSYFADGTLNPNSVPTYPSSLQESQLTSVYGRLNLNYDERFYLQGSLRSDISTRFAPGIRTGNFPSASVAWRLSNEEFLRGNTTITNLKLRLEYGVTGNQDGIGNYDYLAPYTLSNSTAKYQFGSTYYTMYRPSAYYPGRTWEQTSTENLGIDYGFFANRLTGSVDVYYRKTKNLLATINQPAGSNFGNSIVANVGDMEDKGVEFSVSGKIIDTKKLGWTASANVTINRNKITNLTAVANPDFAGILTGGISGCTGNTIQINQVGYTKYSFYALQQVYGTNGKPLDGVFVDRNGDGIINNKDEYIAHSPDPQAYLGLSSELRYNKWNAGFAARASIGNYAYNNIASATGVQRNILNPIGTINNGSSDVLQSGVTGNSSNNVLSDYYLQDASFFRMDNIHVGYNFGKVFKGGSLSVSGNVQNVFVITKYNGLDPEVNGGIDNNVYPRPRTFSLGINLNLQ